MIFAIADDLTGALEVGAKFAAHGMAARVLCDGDSGETQSPVLVIDTESRHLPPEAAAAAISALAAGVAASHPQIVYKKTDSTLRGNIASELDALMRVFPERELVYVPAYPAMGRTVRNGELYVHGIPLRETPFASDPLNPASDGSVRKALGNLPATICDGQTDEDVSAAAEAIAASRDPVLVAGPAAVAGALAKALTSRDERPAKIAGLQSCLVVNGSLHPSSIAQILHARHSGALADGWSLFSYEGKQAGLDRALLLGEKVKEQLETHPVDAILVFGGDTAYGIHRALGGGPFTSCGEALPGIPISHNNGIYWITKAGGFGTPDLIMELRRVLTT